MEKGAEGMVLMFFCFCFSLFQFCNGGDLADYLHCEYNLNFAIGVEFLCCQDLFEPLLSLSLSVCLFLCVCLSLSPSLSPPLPLLFFFLGGGGRGIHLLFVFCFS